MTFADLKTAIADYLANGSATASIPSFVRLAESVIRRDVRVQAMESKATGALASGVLTLPAGFVDARRLEVGGRVHDYVNAEQYAEMEDAGSQARVFTRVGNTIEVLNGGNGSYELLHYAAFPALSADSDTNWLLTNASDVYLFKSLMFAAVFLKDVEAAQAYEGLYQGAKDAVNALENTNKYSGSALTMSIGGAV